MQTDSKEELDYKQADIQTSNTLTFRNKSILAIKNLINRRLKLKILLKHVKFLNIKVGKIYGGRKTG